MPTLCPFFRQQKAERGLSEPYIQQMDEDLVRVSGMPPDLEARAFGARVSASGAKKYLPKHKRTPLNRIHPTGLTVDLCSP